MFTKAVFYDWIITVDSLTYEKLFGTPGDPKAPDLLCQLVCTDFIKNLFRNITNNIN